MTNQLPNEPDLDAGEQALQSAILVLVEGLIESNPGPSLILPGFGLDLAIWRMIDSAWIVKFLELKVFKGARAGGVGFGNPNGTGSQVDLLLAPRDELKRFDNTIAWILGDATQPIGKPRYVIFSSVEAKDAAMGIVGRGKQNNFRIRYLLEEQFLPWQDLCKEVAQFLVASDIADA